MVKETTDGSLRGEDIGRDAGEMDAGDALRRSEERFRFLVENMNDNIFTLDLNARTTYASPSVERILGFTPEERMRQTPEEQITPESLAILYEHLADELQHDRERDPDRSLTLEADFYHKNGSIVTLEVVTSFIRDEAGNPVGVHGLSRDITERKKAETRIREAEKRYRELAESLPQAVFETDKRGVLTYVNEAALRMFGYARDEVVGRLHALEVFTVEDRDRVSSAIAKMMDGSSTGAEREYTARRKDGSTFPCIVYSSLRLDERGGYSGIRGLLTDITRIREYEDELKRLNAELEAYAHTVSHDLKSPIALMAMACSQMETILSKLSLDPGDREQFERTLHIGKEGVGRAVDLIDNILLLAEAGARKSVEEVDVAAVVRMILAEKSARIQERGVVVKADPDLGRLVASPTNIYQIFSNLIGNSLKHNTAAKPLLEVRYLGSEGSEHRYLVRDNGPGIPEYLLGEVFSPFSKGKETGESGLGLAIVKRAIEAHEGRISAYNDGGACFEFTLNSVK